MIYNLCFEALGSKVLTCFESFIGYKPNPNHFFLADAIRRGSWVFTTNGDNLIEEACTLLGIDSKERICYTDDHFKKHCEILNNISNPKNTPGGFLFKLHGSIEQDKEADERFSAFSAALDQVGLGLTESKRHVLEYYLRNFDFCFIGYSCLDDFDIYPVLTKTESNKSIFWFKYAKGPIGELMWSRERLNDELEVEMSKLSYNKIFENININKLLMERDAFYKIAGDCSEFIQNTICPHIDINICINLESGIRSKIIHMDFAKWAETIGEYKKNFILGCLWESCWHRKEAIKCFKIAERLAEDEIQKAKAKRMIARVYDKQYGKVEKDKVIEYYKESLNLFDMCGAKIEAAEVRIDLANFKRRALNQLSDAKKYAYEAKYILESIPDTNNLVLLNINFAT